MTTNRPVTVGKALPGRPRSAEADRAILDAAFQMLVDSGYARMSVEAVAAMAGVGKTTIYRRYAGKHDLAVAVIDHYFPVDNLPKSDDTWQELSALLTRAFQGLITIRGVRLIGMALAEEEANPELFDFFRTRVILKRRTVFRDILERGVKRGHIRPDADLDLAIDLTLGSFVARHLSGVPMPSDWVQRVVTALKQLLGTKDANEERIERDSGDEAMDSLVTPARSRNEV